MPSILPVSKAIIVVLASFACQLNYERNIVKGMQACSLVQLCTYRSVFRALESCICTVNSKKKCKNFIFVNVKKYIFAMLKNCNW